MSSFVGVHPNQVQAGTPAITWVIEDEISLEGGGFVYVQVGQFVTLFDASKAAETFTGIDIDTGETDGQTYSVAHLMYLFNSFALAQMQRQYAPPDPAATEVPV
ncbi:MAG: hypothetical protein LBE61_09800 [Burkholderiaceae bacterium]|nr:hypothetical protein [Burkholderiaceae bacterium]